MGQCVLPFKQTNNDNYNYNQIKIQAQTIFKIQINNINTQPIKIKQIQNIQSFNGSYDYMNTKINNQQNINQLNKQLQFNQKQNSQKKLKSSIHVQKLTLNWSQLIKTKNGNFYDQYQVINKIGQGSYGRVYHVIHKASKISRSLKQIKKRQIIIESKKNLLNQIIILKQIDHPNIIKLHQIFQDKHSYYLVTQYCTGGQLFTRIKGMKSFKQKDAAIIMYQILSAINYMHQKKIVHRDLKPQNILFENKNINSFIKIIDFGASRQFTSSKLKKIVGTPYYIAPEVLQNNYDQKCDIWSCGVILYIILSGYPPFSGKDQKQIFQSIQNAFIVFNSFIFIIDECWNNVSWQVKNLIKNMLKKDPTQRYNTKQCLSNSWFQKHQNFNSIINLDVINRMKQFDVNDFLQNRNKLRMIVMTYIVGHIMPQSELENIKKQFIKFDKDKNGKISKQQLIQCNQQQEVCNMNSIYISNQFQQIINAIDLNNSGEIDFTEFIVASLQKQKILNQQRMQQAFDQFDLDRNGYLDRQQLQWILSGIGKQVLDSIIKQIDQNNDGKIQKKQFFKILQKQIKQNYIQIQ